MYDPQRAEFALEDSFLTAAQVNEYALESYQPLLWRFDAEVLGSNAFGTLVRTELRCYIAYDKDNGEPVLLHDLIDDDESTGIWEQE